MIKRNKNIKGESAARRMAVLSAILLAGAAATCCGLVISVGALRDVWREQFGVRDTRIDVVVSSSGNIVQPDVITIHFGLTNGANLATIPFKELRASLMKRIPNIRNLKIERRLPRRVTIDVEERVPAVRIAPPKGKSDSGRVADFDGVVFRYFNSDPMPIIRESAEHSASPGERLAGNAAAALQLIKFLADAADAKGESSEPELADMRVLEIDTSKRDYLFVTFSDYSTAEIAWDRMGEGTERSSASLKRQLVHLAQAMAAHLTPRTTRWIATDFGPGGRVSAMDPSRTGGH